MRLVRQIAPRLVVRSWGLPPAATNFATPLVDVMAILPTLIMVVWLRSGTCLPGPTLLPCSRRVVQLLFLPLVYLVLLWVLLFQVVVFVTVPSPMGASLPVIGC